MTTLLHAALLAINSALFCSVPARINVACMSPFTLVGLPWFHPGVVAMVSPWCGCHGFTLVGLPWFHPGGVAMVSPWWGCLGFTLVGLPWFHPGVVELARTITFRNSGRTWTGVPLIAANMDTVGTFEMAEALAKHKAFTAVHKHYTVEEWEQFGNAHPEMLDYVAVSSGTSDQDWNKLQEILAKLPKVGFICLDVANGYSEVFVEYVRKVRQNFPTHTILVGFICLDVANGYSEVFVEYVRKVRQNFPTHTILAGNVVTGEMIEELILSGADVIKVGIGPGSVCTTRKKAGVGYPQLSAVIECGDAAHGLKGHIISVSVMNATSLLVKVWATSRQ
ncbi:IMP dehydrogenase/GMP reductase [Trinorchestia longiramus]|nr:IMP dehydrogenase/GMP reductase [Trinorchestia longiramus]